MKTLAVIDLVFLGLIVLFVISCYLRGFVSEFMSMASVILGLLAAVFFYKNGGIFIRTRFMPDLKLIPDILAFIALFLIVCIAVKIIEHILRDIIDRIMLGGVDRFLGILLGFVEGTLVVMLVLFVLTIQPLFDSSSILENSFFARILLPVITGGFHRV
jgi:membrane protein required for colicin V production